MTYREIKEKTYKALDLYSDLKSFLQKDLEAYDIMNNLREDIENNPNNKEQLIKYMQEEKNFFNNDIFNWITEDEFINYCKERFPEITWGYELIERYWVR